MKPFAWVIGLSLVAATGAHAADPSIEDVLKAGEQALRENLDPRVAEFFPPLDVAAAGRLVGRIQDAFAGDDVVDIARFKQVAEAALPLLEQDDASRPYADWLRTRMDYFQAADDLRRFAPAPPTKPKPSTPGKPAPKPANPTPAQQRQVWTRVVATEPWPAEAKRYVPMLKPVFVSESVPPELVWLAEVESRFNPEARSPAGAAGMFQLMPPTAQRMGLAMRPTDQRYQAEKSARASARYLRTLHGEFKDWPLALAAYNAGDGRVRRLLAKSKVKSFDHIASGLSAETQMYVPKIEALIQRREGKALAKL
jgi:membrane-bound lytic murein transglycosylase D